ncbi:hypothetical protein PS15p_208750 [Mucor circinelloides]
MSQQQEKITQGTEGTQSTQGIQGTQGNSGKTSGNIDKQDVITDDQSPNKDPAGDSVMEDTAYDISPEEVIADLEEKIQSSRKELKDIHFFSGRNYTEEAKKAADKAAGDIEWLENQLKTLSSSINIHVRPINMRDIPKFQIIGQAKHFSDHPRFTSVEHFFSAFENVVKASGNQVNSVWRQYIPLSMAFEYNNWTNNDLLNQKDWEAAKELYRKHFGTPDSAEESMAALFSMRMEDSDTLQEYTNTFMKHVQDCGFPVNSNLLARFYQFTLLQKNKQMMINQMAVKHDSKYKWTINEIYECILPLFLVDEQNRGMTKGKRKAINSDAGTPRSLKPSKMANNGLFCAKHGGPNANHNSADCRSRLKNFGSENRPNKATSAAVSPRGKSSSSYSSTCNYCKKTRGPNHWCQEFIDAKRAREDYRRKANINVHTVGTTTQGSLDTTPSENTATTGEGSTSLTTKSPEDIEMAELDKYLDEIDAEDASLNCKSNVKDKHESFNPFQLLTPIILESKQGKPVRLIAKVDTGSDSTFLNRNVFHNKLLFTSQDIISVEGSLNFLSHSVKRLGKTPAIKIRYLNDISFDHSFELSNFIQDLGDFDVLLGVDTLSRLRIGLTGVAHKFADLGNLTEEEKSDLLESIDFENVNFDTKHSIDPETASIFESQAEEKKYMSYIQDAIDENQKIKPGTFCNVPESEITIPIKENVDYYVKQYPIAHHAMPEIEKQLNEWLDAGIVEQCRPNGLFNSPLICSIKEGQ